MKRSPLSLVKKEPASDLTAFEEYERRFEDLFRSHFPMKRARWWTRLAVPDGEVSSSVDIHEEGADIVVKAEIPGMKKEDIHVDINDKTVAIHGEKKKEGKVERNSHARLERTCRSVVRTVDLPEDVQTDKARASFKGGVLEIRVPKTRVAGRQTRKVVNG
jgi:HSP20 family protein